MNSATVVILASVGGVLLVAAVSGWLAYVAASKRRPDLYQHYEQALADMSARLEATDHRVDRLRAALQVEQEYSYELARVMREAGLHPPPRPQIAPQDADGDGMAALARRVAACFSIDEIDTLAFEMGLVGKVTGETLENRAASLVMAALRRGRLSELVAIARRERPNGGF